MNSEVNFGSIDEIENQKLKIEFFKSNTPQMTNSIQASSPESGWTVSNWTEPNFQTEIEAASN